LKYKCTWLACLFDFGTSSQVLFIRFRFY